MAQSSLNNSFQLSIVTSPSMSTTLSSSSALTTASDTEAAIDIESLLQYLFPDDPLTLPYRVGQVPTNIRQKMVTATLIDVGYEFDEGSRTNNGSV